MKSEEDCRIQSASMHLFLEAFFEGMCVCKCVCVCVYMYVQVYDLHCVNERVS